MTTRNEIRVQMLHGEVSARALVVVRHLPRSDRDGDWLLADVRGASVEDALGALSRALLRELARSRGYEEEA